MAGEANEASEIAGVVTPVVAAGVGLAYPPAAPLAGALLDAIGRVIHEAEIAKAKGEVLTGEEILRRSAARVAAAAADPGLPPEIVNP